MEINIDRNSLPRRKTPYLPGVWEGVRLYETRRGEIVAVPLGSLRSDLPGRCFRLLGDGLRNAIGYGEVILTNPCGTDDA